mgnify:CR=1 FL=1
MTGRAGQGPAAGVDGCRAGWFYVALDERGVFRHGLVGRFEEVVDALRHAGLVLVDIPIGLPGAGRPARDCDVAARRAISPRGSTIFPAPSRAALDDAVDAVREMLDGGPALTVLPADSHELARAG